MAKVNITVNGRKYTLGCDDGEEPRLIALGQKLDKRVLDLANQFGQIGDLRLLLMACITILDELDDAQETAEMKADSLAADVRRAGEEAMDEARKREDGATDTLLQAAEKIEQLAEQLKSL